MRAGKAEGGRGRRDDDPSAERLRSCAAAPRLMSGRPSKAC
jgi:hypothetical protein